jgi:undecaprenyl diphosphate synthase
MTLPRHVAIVMDGNGRWAAARGLPRHAGHREGVAPVRTVIELCVKHAIGALTLFAFSSENWRRPSDEVSSIMGLFVEALDREIDELHARGVRVRFIGERRALAVRLQARIAQAEARTAANPGLQLQIAMSYGGRWDIIEAARALVRDCQSGALRAEEITEERFARALALGEVPDPDLFIRTGGEHRISNFLLWNLAYTELFFSDVLWPEFDAAQFEAALEYFAGRERRFGRADGPRDVQRA